MENKKIKILAIDDNRDNLISIKALLSEVLPQSDVFIELSGQGGIESARKNDPDVILLDIVMPVMDGYEVCKTLKADEQLSETPIIFLTALKGDKQSRILALEAGGEAFLAKPIDSSELKAQVLAMVKIKKAATYKRDERFQLEELVQNRTEELKSANIAALNLLEDLKTENEIRKQREEALRMSKELLSETESIGKVGGWSFNIDTMQVKWTDEVYRIHEVEISLVPSVDTGINYYTKESRPIIGKAVQRAIEHGENYDLELEIITAKGNTRAIHTIGKADLKNRRIYGFFQDITERKQAEEHLQKFKQIVSSTSDGISLLDKNYRYVIVNIAYESFSAKKQEELIGLTVAEYLGEVNFNEHVKAKFNRCLNGETIKFQEWFKYPTLGKRFVEVTYFPYINNKGEISGVVANTRDITERKQAEEKLKLLNRAVEASSVAVEITDAEGNINYVNPFFTELTGYSYEEAWGKNPRFLKSGNHPKEFYKDLWGTILSGKDWTGEFQNKKKNGELYWEKAVISPIMNSNGEVTNFVAIKEDVTEGKRTMEELGTAKEKAEESDRLKTAFLHNISHEIRTPMNAIIGFSALLSEPELNEESITFYTETITQSSNQLLSIIDDIVDISNIEAGIVNISKEEIRINRSLDRLIDQFSLMAKEKGIVLCKVAPLQDEEAIIFADNTKFMQVISNLLTNAFKFTNEGTVEFGYKPGKDFIEFYVSDTGIGIPGDQLTRIFERFYQVDFNMARLNEGTGLGLAISKSYIDLMGGKIWVESDPGKGSKFLFTLPFYKSGEEEVTVLPEKQQYTFDREYNILVAEDDKQSSRLINSFLSIPGLKVTIVGNGAEAVDHCRSGNPVDLVLMDLKMPFMDGFEAARLIKEFLPDLPVIAQTAYAQESDKEKAISLGCNDFITKPFRKETLISKIRDNLSL